MTALDYWIPLLMRFARGLALVISCGVLAACLAPLLLLPSPTDLMLSVLKPLVGLDPNVVHLYDQPLVRERMTALFGTRYDTALSLLKTADQLQQEGPLFFVVSRYTPAPELAQKAGLVWNANTNQMAAAFVRGDGLELFSETLTNKIEDRAVAEVDAQASAVVPQWPTLMQAWIKQ